MSQNTLRIPAPQPDGLQDAVAARAIELIGEIECPRNPIAAENAILRCWNQAAREIRANRAALAKAVQ